MRRFGPSVFSSTATDAGRFPPLSGQILWTSSRHARKIARHRMSLNTSASNKNTVGPRRLCPRSGPIETILRRGVLGLRVGRARPGWGPFFSLTREETGLRAAAGEQGSLVDVMQWRIVLKSIMIFLNRSFEPGSTADRGSTVAEDASYIVSGRAVRHHALEGRQVWPGGLK